MFAVRIEIIHRIHSLYYALAWLTLISLHFVTGCRSDNIFAKLMLPMLKLDTNSGFHELFLIYKQDDIIQMLDFLIDNIFALFWWTGISTNDWYSSGSELCSAIHRFVSTCL